MAHLQGLRQLGKEIGMTVMMHSQVQNKTKELPQLLQMSKKVYHKTKIDNPQDMV